MSKYIIDTGDYLFTTDGVLVVGFDCDNKPATFYNSLDNLEELNSDYINEHYGSMQDEAYRRGLEDAWEAARKIIRMPDGDILDLFPDCYASVCTAVQAILKYDASEAIAKLKAYEDGKHSDRIEVGDEIRHDIQGIGVATRINEVNGTTYYNAVWSNGNTGYYRFDDLKKTGKHYDIQSILEAMRE